MYTTLIVVDEPMDFGESIPGVISFDTYLQEYPKRKESKTRIINLCNTDCYLSKGYYCSLLAAARNHKVLPSVKTINALRILKDDSPRHDSLTSGENKTSTEQHIFFGKSDQPALQKLANKIFAQHPAPALKIQLPSTGNGSDVRIENTSFSALNDDDKKVFIKNLKSFTETVWRTSYTPKRFRWDMAILVNPTESNPPSDKEAIARFIKAAGKLGINAVAVRAEELSNIAYYDALFIRETTAIDHHTYRLAIEAEDAGLVVIDDSQSILRCCNKVFLHDAFSYQNVPSLETKVVNELSESSMTALEKQFGYPLILKMPEGSFSYGVFKVNNRAELHTQLQQLFSQSALVLAQEYLYTEFDWRIGILNGRAIYACRYLMARDHWQIYNHDSKKHNTGAFETLPTFEVPKAVLDAALKAAKTVGNGLYGVDVKELNHKAYVLEVNDNPSLEHKVEDAYLGNELYMQIMGEFQRRLELRGRSN